MAAVGAANTGEAVLEVAAPEELADGRVEHGAPVAELTGVAFSVDGAEVVEMVSDEAVEVGLEGLAGVVDAG